MAFVCLCYHQIADHEAASADPLTVPPACFRAQMAWLSRQGYVGVSLSTALAPGLPAPVSGPQTRRPIALTFDDGYQDFFTTAWPILAELGFGATIFLVSDRLCGRADWFGATGSPLLTADEARALSEEGVEIAAHGHTHAVLDRSTPNAVQEELSRARETLIAALGQTPNGLAYPYGQWSTTAARLAEEAGYRWAATARGGVNRQQTPPYKLRRTQVTGADCGKLGRWRFAAKVGTGYASLLDWRMDLRRLP